MERQACSKLPRSLWDKPRDPRQQRYACPLHNSFCITPFIYFYSHSFRLHICIAGASLAAKNLLEDGEEVALVKDVVQLEYDSDPSHCTHQVIFILFMFSSTTFSNLCTSPRSPRTPTPPLPSHNNGAWMVDSAGAAYS